MREAPKFRKVLLGYKPAQVDSYIKLLSVEIQFLRCSLEEIRLKAILEEKTFVDDEATQLMENTV